MLKRHFKKIFGPAESIYSNLSELTWFYSVGRKNSTEKKFTNCESW